MKKTLLFLLTLSFIQYLSAQTTNVLFIGNSITASGVHDMFREISNAKGHPVYTEMYWNGQLLMEHVQDQSHIDMLKQKLNERNWDYVVLQENSAVSGFYPGWTQGYFEFYSYYAAKQICQIIREINPCTEVVFFMTYGYLNGDVMNFPNDTYLKQQTRIRRNYLLLADSNSAIVAPVGMAWKKIRDTESWYEDLYASPGDHHPGPYGTFLAGCVFYSVIFNDYPSGSGFTAGLDILRVNTIEQTAGKVVFDSSDVWNVNVNVPEAGFKYNVNNKFVQFSSFSESKLCRHKWYFGNGDSSMVQNPGYHYPADGQYIVTHIVSSNCYPADTTIDTIVISTVSLRNFNPGNVKIRYENGKRIAVSMKEMAESVMLICPDGKIIRQYHPNSQEFIFEMPEEYHGILIMIVKTSISVYQVKLISN